MSENPYKDDLSRFFVTFVRAVIAWNRAEESARHILSSLAEGGLGTLAAIAHLGSRGLQDAILTVATHWDDEETPALQEISRHVKHFIDGLDTVRAYRNFYVHSLQALGKGADDGGFKGLLYATEARGRYAWVRQYVTTEELETFMRHCEGLRRYGQSIADYLQKDNALTPHVPPKQPLTSLQKPIWPDKLKKSRSYLLTR